MKNTVILLVALIISGCTSVSPSGQLTPYHTQTDLLSIDYALPAGSIFLSGPAAPVVTFSENRPYPIQGVIANVGWAFCSDIPQVHIYVGLLKIPKPLFLKPLALSELEPILIAEHVSLPVAGKSMKIVRDAAGCEWLETTVEVGGKIAARSYLRPIAPDTLILLPMNFGEKVRVEDRARAFEIQNKMLAAIHVFPRNEALKSD